MANNKQESETLTTDLRKTLKAMFKKELEALPETLSKLEPDKRLNILVKLMPYIMPKVEAVQPSQGESGSWDL